MVGSGALATLGAIEKLFRDVTPIEASDAVKMRAAERALAGKAPCHHANKNSVADAVIVETYFECVQAGDAGQRFAFVTHNTQDFSDTDHRMAHPDIANRFSRIKSLYFINLADCLRRVDPELTRELYGDFSYEQEPRPLWEILDAEDELFTKVWYNRHKNLAWSIEHGRHKIVTRGEWDANHSTKGYGQTHTIDEIWNGALKAARKAEKKLGEGNYGPWDDFEWGMINGKLSALRWVLGDEWDALDT
jgi:hypothetical protein